MNTVIWICAALIMFFIVIPSVIWVTVTVFSGFKYKKGNESVGNYFYGLFHVVAEAIN